jgi:predicted amino acid-binding ACT domain protein
MTLLLPDCKVEAIKAHCTHLLAHHEVSVRVLSQLIEKLTASIQVILPAPQHYRHLQHLKHQALAQGKSYEATIALPMEAREKSGG